MFDFVQLGINSINKQPIRFKQRNSIDCQLRKNTYSVGRKTTNSRFQSHNNSITKLIQQKFDKNHYLKNLRKINQKKPFKVQKTQNNQCQMSSIQQAVQLFIYYINNQKHQPKSLQKYFKIRQINVQLSSLEAYFFSICNQLSIIHQKGQLIDLYEQFLRQQEINQSQSTNFIKKQQKDQEQWKLILQNFILKFYQQNMGNDQTFQHIKTQKSIKNTRANLSDYYMNYSNNQDSFLLNKINKNVNIFEDQKSISDLLSISRKMKNFNNSPKIPKKQDYHFSLGLSINYTMQEAIQIQKWQQLFSCYLLPH